jgi:phosphatidate cytidylyltransferase
VLIQRVLTAAVVGAVVIGAVLFAPRPVAAVVLGAFWLVGFWEWCRFAALGRAPAFATLAVAALVMVVSLGFPTVPAVFATVLVLALGWWLFALGAVLSYPLRLGPALTLFAGAATLLPAWALLALVYRSGTLGPELVLCLLLIVWAADMGAYFFGSRLGRLKLAPSVSPKKTWEGVVGGILCAVLTGWLLDAFVAVAGVRLAILAPVAGFGSVLGDLTVSMFKRNCGLKDSGMLLPGHGGVLDRIDSLTSAVAVFAGGLFITGSLD